MITLSKISSPGWDKNFNTVEEFKAALWNCICGMCRNGVEFGDPPLHKDSLIVDMWMTSCGCEYNFEDPDNLITPLS